MNQDLWEKLGDDARAEEAAPASPNPRKDNEEARRRAEWLHNHNAPFDWMVVTIDEIVHLRAEFTTLRARVAELEAEILSARKEWVGDDFAHLPLGPALGALREKLANEADARVAELEAALRYEKRLHPEDFFPGDFRERALNPPTIPGFCTDSPYTNSGLRTDNPLTEQVFGGRTSEPREI